MAAAWIFGRRDPLTAGPIDQPERDCGEAAAIARQHLRDIEERIARLQTLRSALVGVAASCDGGRAADCHVIEAIAGVALPAPD
jgi:hypothetical protein